MSKKRPRKKKPLHMHPTPWHVLLTPLEFELPLAYYPDLNFRNVFKDISAFGLTPSFSNLLDTATAARRALILHLTTVSNEFSGSTPLHHHISLKRRTNMLYTQGKQLHSLVDAYLHPLSKLCALHEGRHIVEEGNVMFAWSDMSPALNNRKEMFSRYHKLLSEEYVTKDKNTGDLIYIMRHKSIHFERFNVMFLKGLLYYTQAALKMHKLKNVNSAKLLAETWNGLQEAAGVFQNIRQSSIKFEHVANAVRAASVHSPSLRVLANFVSLQQHFVALGVEISKGTKHGRVANMCSEFFATSQVVVEMAISLDISLSPQTKPLREICQFMNLFLRGLYFKHLGTQRAASKRWKTAEVCMDLAYRSLNSKVKATIHAMEGGPEPLSHAIKEECDDAYKNTTDFGAETSDRKGIPQIRQQLLGDLAVGDFSVLSRKMGSELTFVPFHSLPGAIDTYLVRKGASGARSRSNNIVDPKSMIPQHDDELQHTPHIHSRSYIEGERIKELVKDKPAKLDFLSPGQHLPDMFEEDHSDDMDATQYLYPEETKTPSKRLRGEAARRQRQQGINWSATRVGQQKVFFERIMTNHELASRGVFLERKKIRPTSAASSRGSPRKSPRESLEIQQGSDDVLLELMPPEFVPPARDQLCAMCENMYSELPGTVTQNAILRFRGERTARPASWKYRPVNICVFCLQFHYQRGGATASSLMMSSSLPTLLPSKFAVGNSGGVAASMHASLRSSAHLERTASQQALHAMKQNLAPEDIENLAALSAAHKQKNYRRKRRKSSLQLHMSESTLNLLVNQNDEEQRSVALSEDGRVKSLDKIDTLRVLSLSRVPKQALFTRGEKSAAGKVNELFYNMAAQYEDDDKYDHWASYLEEHFTDLGELDSLRLFFTRISDKPESLLDASNMTMEGTANLSVLLDLLSEGPQGDWRVQNILRSSKQVNHMMRSGIGASIRLNDADRVGNITYHQFLAIVKSSNEPWIESEHALDAGSSIASSTAALWTLPGADRSALLADIEDEQRKLDIRSVSEGVVGGANHLRHIEHADEQYYRVRELIRSMNVLMPGETHRMRNQRHKKGHIESLVASVHQGRQDRENEKKKHEELLVLQRKAHELGNLQLSSAERAKLAAEGGGVLMVHKKKCALCTRLFSKPNLPTQATRGAIEDLRKHLAEKAEKRILLAKFQGKRVEIKRAHHVLSEFVLVRQFDNGLDAFVVVHSNGRKKLHPWKKARAWKLFARTKESIKTLKEKEEEKEKERKKKEREEKSDSHQADLPPGGRRASRWGNVKGATSVFGNAVRAKKKTVHIQSLKEKQEADDRVIQKLSALKSGGKARRIANRSKATAFRAYDRIRLCVFCTQFYTHHVEMESQHFIELKAPEPKTPTFDSVNQLMKEEEEERLLQEEEERKLKDQEEEKSEIHIEEDLAYVKNSYRILDRLPELEEEERDTSAIDGSLAVKLPEVYGEKVDVEVNEEANREEMEEELDEEEEQNRVNDLMTLLGLNLAKIGDIAYQRFEHGSLKDRLRYLGAIRVQSCARSFLIRARMIRTVYKEMNALKGGISEFQEQIDELRKKKKELLQRKKRNKGKKQTSSAHHR